MVTKLGDWEESLIVLSILPVLWLSMPECAYLANPMIENGVGSNPPPNPNPIANPNPIPDTKRTPHLGAS